MIYIHINFLMHPSEELYKNMNKNTCMYMEQQTEEDIFIIQEEGGLKPLSLAVIPKTFVLKKITSKLPLDIGESNLSICTVKSYPHSTSLKTTYSIYLHVSFRYCQVAAVLQINQITCYNK